MAEKATSKKTTSGKRKASEPKGPKKSVVLVVKGIGVHKADDTLNLFLKGFLPAVTEVSKVEHILERSDVYKPESVSEHERDNHNHVTEIQTELGDIWVKEIYWEGALRPPNSIKALLGEWNIATYSWGRVIYDNMVGHLKQRHRGRWQNAYYPIFLKYLSVLLLPAYVFTVQPGLFNELGNWSIFSGLSIDWINIIAGVLVLIGFTLVIAFSPTIYTLKWEKISSRWNKPRLLGIGNWVLPFLTLAIVYDFLAGDYYYFKLLGIILGLLIISVLARVTVWKKRPQPDSDTDGRNYYKYVYESNGKVKERFVARRKPPLTSLLYRYILVILLPVGFVVLLLAEFLIWTKVFEIVGRTIHKVLGSFFSNAVGDLVSYAKEPDQAQRIRSVLINEIKYFDAHPDVSEIHVFAHSFGTVVTYETLFRHLPIKYRGKIKTYVTIGTVLNALRKANPVLDRRFVRRFPIYFSKDDGHGFTYDFRWFNIWNAIDPATEFYALDEYFNVEDISILPTEDNIEDELDVRRKTLRELRYSYQSKEAPSCIPVSPTNIRTKVLADPHSGYWTDLTDVHIPFVERILIDKLEREKPRKKSPVHVPDRWNRDKIVETDNLTGNTYPKYRRSLLVALFSWLVGLPILGYGVSIGLGWLFGNYGEVFSFWQTSETANDNTCGYTIQGLPDLGELSSLYDRARDLTCQIELGLEWFQLNEVKLWLLGIFTIMAIIESAAHWKKAVDLGKGIAEV